MKPCKSCKYAAVCLGRGAHGVRKALVDNYLAAKEGELFPTYEVYQIGINMMMKEQKFPHGCPALKELL